MVPAPVVAPAPVGRDMTTRELNLMRLLVTAALLAFAWDRAPHNDMASGIIIGGVVAYWLPVSVDRLRPRAPEPPDIVT